MIRSSTFGMEPVRVCGQAPHGAIRKAVLDALPRTTPRTPRAPVLARASSLFAIAMTEGNHYDHLFKVILALSLWHCRARDAVAESCIPTMLDYPSWRLGCRKVVSSPFVVGGLSLGNY